MQTKNTPPLAVPSEGLVLKDYVKVSLVDLVANQLRAGIFSGKYLPGQKMIVRELSEDLEVSHTPIKEALNRLVAEGLVEAFPGRSMVVRSFTNDELIENMGVRLMCEIFAAEEIVTTASSMPEIIQEMEEQWENMAELLRAEGSVDHEAWVGCETLFHRAYVAACGNSKLVQVYNALDINRFTYFAYLHNNSSPLGVRTYELNMVEHREILDALKEGDVAGFTRAVARHVTRACDDYVVDDAAKIKIELLRRSAAPYL